MVECYINDEYGKPILTFVSGELEVGNRVKCGHIKTGPQTLIYVNKHLLVIRNENGFTKTLLRRQPIFDGCLNDC